MAISPKDVYTGKVNGASSNYPYGSAKNITVAGDNTGTPLDKDWLNDVWGFLQYWLVDAGVAPSGNPETVLASQYATAIKSRITNSIGLHNTTDLNTHPDIRTLISGVSERPAIGIVLCPAGSSGSKVYLNDSSASTPMLLEGENDINESIQVIAPTTNNKITIETSNSLGFTENGLYRVSFTSGLLSIADAATFTYSIGFTKNSSTINYTNQLWAPYHNNLDHWESISIPQVSSGRYYSVSVSGVVEISDYANDLIRFFNTCNPTTQGVAWRVHVSVEKIADI
jgi:hypothetical protein